MLVLFCQTCCKGFSTYRKWIAHLLSPVHQKKARNKIKDWSKKLQSRGIIFTEFCKPKEEIGEDVIAKLAWSVSEYTIISDLYFDCDKQVCVILIDETKGAEYIVDMTHEIKAGTCQPFKRLATDVPESDWEDIFKKRSKKRQPLKDLIENNCVHGNTNECEVRNDLQAGDEAVSENSFSKDVQLKNSFVGDVTSEKSFAEDVTLENIFAEDATLQNDFFIANNSVLASFNDSVVKSEPLELEKNSETSDINDEFAVFMKENLLSRDAVKKRKMVVRQLAQILKDSYESAVVYPFEDGLNNLNFLKKSSLAVGIDINGNFNRTICPVKMSKQDIKKIRELLCSAKPDGAPFCINLYENIFQRGFSLNFTHNRSKIEVECFFFRKSSQQKWKFVSACMEADPRSLPLTQFLVCWYEKYLSDFGHGQTELPNKFLVYYPFIQLVIYFLIYKGILPSTVFCWQTCFANNKQINRKNIGFCDDIVDMLRGFEQPQESVYSINDTNAVTGKPSAKCILGLAAEFFEYFWNVDLKNNIVSLPIGALVKKEGYNLRFRSRKKAIYSYSDETVKKLRTSYGKLSTNKSCMPTSLIVQDSCDQQTYEFSQQWSATSLADFKNRCFNTSLAIQNVLFGNSSMTDLRRFFLRDSTTENLIKPCGYISHTKMVVQSTCFNIPREVTMQFNTSNGRAVKKFWFHVMKKFFDEVLEGVLKLHIKSTHVEGEERHNYIKHSKAVESELDTNEMTEYIVPRKKQKRNGGNGNAVSEENQISIEESLSKLELPYRKLYIRTYFVESRCFKLIQELTNKMRWSSTRKRGHELKDPLEREKMISDFLVDDETKDAFEMTCKIIIDCRPLVAVAGIQIEAPCDDQGSNINILREITAFIGDLATKYILYRAYERF